LFREIESLKLWSVMIPNFPTLIKNHPKST